MKLAVYFHAKLAGPDFGIDTAFSLQLFAAQMKLMQDVGLAAAADHFVIGLNDGPQTLALARGGVLDNAEVILHPPGSRSELPTLHALQKWLPGHEDWLVCYFHAKGITHPHDELCGLWRRCMTNVVVRGWRQCVADLEAGYETVGAHWLTREQYGPMVNTFFWGGNFWWAKANFLAELPPLKANSTCRDDDFLAELWIGQGRRPKVRDYAPHWPGLDSCGRKCFLISQ
jgi:hypothetical protein